MPWQDVTHRYSDCRSSLSIGVNFLQILGGAHMALSLPLPFPVMHLPVKFGADIFIQSGVIDILPKLKMSLIAVFVLLTPKFDGT